MPGRSYSGLGNSIRKFWHFFKGMFSLIVDVSFLSYSIPRPLIMGYTQKWFEVEDEKIEQEKKLLSVEVLPK